MNRNRGQSPIPNPARSLNPVPGMCFRLVSFPTSLTQLWLPPCCSRCPISCPMVHTCTPLFWHMTIPRIGWIWQESAYVAPIWPFPAHRSNVKQTKVIAKSLSTLQHKREFSIGSVHLTGPKSRLLPLNSVAAHTTSIVHTLSSSF